MMSSPAWAASGLEQITIAFLATRAFLRPNRVSFNESSQREAGCAFRTWDSAAGARPASFRKSRRRVKCGPPAESAGASSWLPTPPADLYPGAQDRLPPRCRCAYCPAGRCSLDRRPDLPEPMAYSMIRVLYTQGAALSEYCSVVHSLLGSSGSRVVRIPTLLPIRM